MTHKRCANESKQLCEQTQLIHLSKATRKSVSFTRDDTQHTHLSTHTHTKHITINRIQIHNLTSSTMSSHSVFVYDLELL